MPRSIAGALVYGITRISYVGFYGEFGLDPEDVGIGYAATLSRALPGLLVPVALYFLPTVPFVWLLRRHDRQPGRVNERQFQLATLLAFFAIGGFCVVAPITAQHAASEVGRGNELRAPSGLVSWGEFRDPLGFTVREIDVEWVADETGARTKLGRPLMLLGTDSDVYYLYDVQFRRTVRLPRTLIIIREDIG